MENEVKSMKKSEAKKSTETSQNHKLILDSGTCLNVFSILINMW